MIDDNNNNNNILHLYCANIMFKCALHDTYLLYTYWECFRRILLPFLKHRGKPLLFHEKCPGFFYVHYTTHGTYSFTSHPKDEAIMVNILLKDTSAAAGIRSHILATPEFESNAPDRSATTLHDTFTNVTPCMIQSCLRYCGRDDMGIFSQDLPTLKSAVWVIRPIAYYTKKGHVCHQE